MSTRQDLLKRPDLSPEEVDDVIGIAARLQDEALDQASGPTAAEIAAVASELDIAPEYVEQALTRYQEQKEQKEQALRDKVARARRTRRVALGATGVVLGAALLSALGGAVGASALDTAATDVAEAEARVTAVVQRQQDLIPGLVAASGGVASIWPRIREGAPLAEQLAVSSEVSQTAMEVMGRLPAASTDAEAQLRLNLTHELSGAQNRISTELARYEQALARWEQASATTTGRLALLWHMAEPKPQ